MSRAAANHGPQKAPCAETMTSQNISLPRFTLRDVFSFPVMLVAWIVLVVIRLAERNLPDPDIWWHLRNAQYLFENYHLPSFDTYSFTVAGQPWINHEWLAEIPYYLAYRTNGLMGIEILMLVLLEAIFLGVLFLCYQRSRHIKASILACWIAVFFATINFGPRTVLFGYACIVILLAVLERFRTRQQAPLWILPVLFCLWINSHGSWSLGILIFGFFIVSGFVQGEWGRLMSQRWTAPELRKLLVAFAASCAALFINPYGYRLVLYPLIYATRLPLNIASTEEWQTVNLHALRGKVVLVVLAGLFCSALMTNYRWRLSDLGLLLFAFYSGLTYERFLFLAGIIAAPVIAEMLYFVPPYRPEIDKRWLNAAIIVGILAFVSYRFPSPADLDKQVAEQYPSEILPYLESHELAGRVFNFYDWGGYLEWNVPKMKVFVDSRVDIFEYAGVFGDYLKAHTLVDAEGVLDKYQVRYVLFPSQQPLTKALRSNPDWKVLYSGQISTLLERQAVK